MQNRIFFGPDFAPFPTDSGGQVNSALAFSVVLRVFSLFVSLCRLNVTTHVRGATLCLPLGSAKVRRLYIMTSEIARLMAALLNPVLAE